MPIDMFTTRVMTKAVNRMFKPKMFLRDFFFGKSERHESEKIDIDKYTGGRAPAIYSNPHGNGNTVEKKSFSTSTFIAPYINEEMPTTAVDIEDRSLGEDIYSKADTPAKRLRKQLATDMETLNDRIDRAEEVQAATALQTGIVTVSGKDVDYTIDWGIPASHKIVLAGGDLWSAPTTADPMSTFRLLFDAVKNDSGKIPKDFFLGSDALNYLLRIDEFKELLDIKNISVGQIAPGKLTEKFLQYIGTLKYPNINLWEYSDIYEDPNSGIITPYVETNKVFCVGQGANLMSHYGAIKDLDALEKLNTWKVKRFAKSYKTNRPDARWVNVKASPLMAIHDELAVAVATVA